MRLFDDNGYWIKVRDGDDRAFSIFSRHYSFRKWRNRKGLNGKRMVGPGESIVLLGKDGKALFIWKKEKYRKDGQTGIECAVFRNEGGGVSSKLIEEAENIASTRWPGERLFTYVNSKLIQSVNPGYCFKANGWRQCGISAAKKLIILEKLITPCQ